MKERIISLPEARKTLAKMPEQFSKECPAIVITRNNQPILSIMPYETHQALLENIASLQTLLEIMAGKETGEASKPEKARAHRASWEEFQKEVGW